MDDIFSADFQPTPFWWDGFAPPEDAPGTLPGSVEVLVIGGGYAGIGCALTLAEAGRDVLVLDAGRLGQGASTRSGGQITGGVNVQAKSGPSADAAQRSLREGRLRDTAAAMTWIETRIEQHQIRCGYVRSGRLTALWTPPHAEIWAGRLDELNRLTDADARMMSREELREELGSDAYSGAALIGRAGHLQPAQLYGGLLGAARQAGARVHGMTPVESITRERDGSYRVATARGVVKADKVVLATNGYPSAVNAGFRRDVIPITSHMIATEILDPELASDVIRHNRAVSETRRVVNHYRLSSDGRRLLFGGRARFTPTSEKTTAKLLYRMMTRRFPQLAGTRISHSWGGNVAMTFDYMPHMGNSDGLHWLFGCNGSGVAMMSWLGHMVGRKILSPSDDPICAFDNGTPRRNPLYFGTPWFLFAVGSWYQFLDAVDRKRAGMARV